MPREPQRRFTQVWGHRRPEEGSDGPAPLGEQQQQQPRGQVTGGKKAGAARGHRSRSDQGQAGTDAAGLRAAVGRPGNGRPVFTKERAPGPAPCRAARVPNPLRHPSDPAGRTGKHCPQSQCPPGAARPARPAWGLPPLQGSATGRGDGPLLPEPSAVWDTQPSAEVGHSAGGAIRRRPPEARCRDKGLGSGSELRTEKVVGKEAGVEKVPEGSVGHVRRAPLRQDFARDGHRVLQCALLPRPEGSCPTLSLRDQRTGRAGGGSPGRGLRACSLTGIRVAKTLRGQGRRSLP